AEERRLPRTLEQIIELKGRPPREDLGVGPVPNASARETLRDLADDTQLAALDERSELGVGARLTRVGEDSRLTAMERHRPGLAIAIDLDIETLRKRVDDRGADAVQTAR